MKDERKIICPDNICHIYNRGVEKRTIFCTEEDYNYFLERIIFYREITGVKLLGYSIMPNHYHFILKEPTLRVEHPKGGYRLNINHFVGSSISKFMGLLANSYTKYFNSKHDHSGRIFQGPFKYKIINSDNYLRKIISYVNLNPLKHKIVKNIKDWLYTSHHECMDKKNLRLIDGEFLIDFDEYKDSLDSYIKDLEKIDDEF